MVSRSLSRPMPVLAEVGKSFALKSSPNLWSLTAILSFETRSHFVAISIMFFVSISRLTVISSVQSSLDISTQNMTKVLFRKASNAACCASRSRIPACPEYPAIENKLSFDGTAGRHSGCVRHPAQFKSQQMHDPE